MLLRKGLEYLGLRKNGSTFPMTVALNRRR
jgi:hypothetical protein